VSNVRANFYNENKVDYIEISIIGDQSTVVRKVTEQDKQRFKSDWDGYKKAEDVVVEGMPLTDVKGIGAKLAKKLESNGIRTAEELAEMPDGALPLAVGMGGMTIRKEAQAMLNNEKQKALDRIIDA
jgi:nucleotidyltransferase/DNA polymerase involved in DNA repair|tara:strand:- start:790 stop:1170 length:381 start_codon:yes stop_codon:yes gene_type:complete